MHLPFPETITSISVRALFLGERLDLRTFEVAPRLASAPLTVTAGEHGCAVLFRYGAAVLFNLRTLEQATFLSQLGPFIVEAFAAVETEDTRIELSPKNQEGISGSGIQLSTIGLGRLQIVADILAKSVVLAHYEKTVAEVFDRVEPLAAGLERKGRAGPHGRELLQHIGGSLLVQQKMVGRVEVVEKPELLWEHPELERLYVRLEDEYEIAERHVALGRKLDLISNTAHTLVDLLQNKRSLRVEWYIVILIAIEIFLTLYQMIFGMK